jgi:hypothetical protein
MRFAWNGMAIKPRIAAALVALTLFLLGLAAIWRLARRDEVAVQREPQASPPTSVQPARPPQAVDLPRPTVPSVTTVPAADAVRGVDQSATALTPPRPMAQANVGPKPSPAPAGSPASAEDAVAVRIALDEISLMFRDYRTRMGGNPEGTNAEIMRAVMGGNPKGARLGPPEGQNLNARGELVDRWGTAYFFHQMSAKHMEIHSAGPDKVFGTNDDIVQK